MKSLLELTVVPEQFGNDGGLFRVTSPVDGKTLTVIASFGGGWDHVSVSHPKRIPNWLEMSYIKRVFFDAHETVMELHPPESEYINNHPRCLHLWRPHGVEIPCPPTWMVGVPGVENVTPAQARSVIASAIAAFGGTVTQ